MAKHHNKVEKTLVEKMLDKAGIAYVPYEFPTEEVGDVAQLTVDHLDVPEHQIYKTLVLTGNKTGPVVGVVPLDRHVDYKKLSKVSGNRKVGMVPLKDLMKTTGYEHGANTPSAFTNGISILFLSVKRLRARQRSLFLPVKWVAQLALILKFWRNLLMHNLRILPRKTEGRRSRVCLRQITVGSRLLASSRICQVKSLIAFG